MAQNYHSLIPEIKQRIKEEMICETLSDTDELVGLPNPYVVPGKDKHGAQYYWDTYFINLGLIRMKMIDYARRNVENLIFLQRKFGFVPASNKKDMLNFSQPPLLPWMVRDIYRATGDKPWLRRMLPDVEKEFRHWISKTHSSPSGLYRYRDGSDESAASQAESGWSGSPRFANGSGVNPVDLNALIYRNAKLIYDLQKEVDGKGDHQMTQKAEQLKRLMDLCWDEDQGFYFDNDFKNKRLSPIKSLAGFVPMFVKMVDEERAKRLHSHLKDFALPGGLSCTDKDYGNPNTPWNYPLCYAPYIYFTIKALLDYDMLEDAADIGTNWLSMVSDIYKKTGEFWEWYNVKEKSVEPLDGVENTPIMGWTAGTYIALVDALGLD